jgi:pantetheine-phosphate adenylyltransferase
VQRVTKPLGNVEVRQFSGLAVQFVRECKARVIIRGVRSLSDMDSEFTMTLANRKLDPGIETVFLMADEEFSHVSSSLIKQITPLADDEHLARFVPREIIADLRAKLSE